MYKLKYNKNIRTSFRLILVVIVLRKFNFQFLKLVGYTQEKSSNHPLLIMNFAFKTKDRNKIKFMFSNISIQPFTSLNRKSNFQSI